MKRIYGLAGLVVLVLVGLGCSLANYIPLLNSNSDASTPLDEAALQAAGQTLQEAVDLQGRMAVFDASDVTGDGELDILWVWYPVEEVLPGVYARPTLIYNTENNPSAEAQEIVLQFSNQSGFPREFDYIYEVPKHFAEYVTEMTFSPEPVEIINPDAEVKFQVSMADSDIDWSDRILITTEIGVMIGKYALAEQRLKENAAADLEKICPKLPADKQSACWLSLVEDFGSVLAKDKQVNLCMNATGYERRMCLAIARDSAEECNDAATKDDQMACRGYYVLHKCEELDGGEYQGCLRDQSIANKAPLSCTGLTDDDVRNDCYARAGRDAEFCKKINNPARKEACQKALGVKTGSTGRTGSKKEWFTGGQAARDCEYFHSSFSGYTVDYALGDYFHDINKLSCAFKIKFVDGTNGAVNIWINGYLTTQEAQVAWDEEFGPKSTFATTRAMDAKTNPSISTFTSDDESLFSTYWPSPESKPDYYHIDGAAIYQNATIWFKHDYAVGNTPAIWNYVRQAAEVLIDQKNR